jgi:hypothetical protein
VKQWHNFELIYTKHGKRRTYSDFHFSLQEAAEDCLRAGITEKEVVSAFYSGPAAWPSEMANETDNYLRIFRQVAHAGNQ